MHKIFVTATNTDIGKTHTSKLLLRHYASCGYRVGALKPIETGVTSTPTDGSTLLALAQSLNPSLNHLHVDDIVPIQLHLPAAPFVANDAQNIDLNPIKQALEMLEPLCDIVIIEGAGGLMVPIDTTTMMIDLVKYSQAKTLLVSHCRLGCINDTLLNLRLLQEHNIPYVLAFNCKEAELEQFEKISQPYFDTCCNPYYLLNSDLTPLSDCLLRF